MGLPEYGYLLGLWLDLLSLLGSLQKEKYYTALYLTDCYILKKKHKQSNKKSLINMLILNSF